MNEMNASIACELLNLATDLLAVEVHFLDPDVTSLEAIVNKLCAKFGPDKTKWGKSDICCADPDVLAVGIALVNRSPKWGTPIDPHHKDLLTIPEIQHPDGE
jgi:hypothetical protein